MSVEDSGAKKDGSGAGAGPFAPGNLVVYKSAPARVLTAGQKIEIETAEGSRVSVRGKDILLLHPGPVSSLRFDLPPAGEVREAWEMLQGQRTTAAEFAELLFGTSGPGECWAVYSLALDGLYARGTPGDFILLSREEHQAVADARDEAEREARERSLLLDRLRTGKTLPQDRKPLREVEDVAFGRSGTSRILRDLKIPNLPEKAHALLLKLGVWDESVNPHPARLGLSLEGAFPALEDYPDGERLDLTGLPAFAVDDEGSEDPDDAISVDGDTLWVHIADPAQAVRPGTEADLFARERGANLYLPEGKVPMLPPETTERFGLGLGDTSPALSFAVKLAPDGSLAEHRILLTRVRVTRLSFREAQERLDQGPLRDIHAVTSRYNAFRRKNGAVSLRLPEVKIRAASGEVTIRPLPPTDAQTMVTDAMLMAGEAAARYAIEKGLPLPYASQEPPDSPCDPRTLSEMWACRRQMRAGSVSSFPAPTRAWACRSTPGSPVPCGATWTWWPTSRSGPTSWGCPSFPPRR